MQQNQNTPPHAHLSITVHNDMQIDAVKGLHNTSVDFRGCHTCAAEAIAELMVKEERFRDLVFKSLMIYAIVAAKAKEQNGN